MIEKSEWYNLLIILKLMEIGAHQRIIKISTDHLAGKIGTSQQTASRYLIILENKGWIERTITSEGCLIKITKTGFKQMKNLYSKIHHLMETKYPPSIILEGIVFTGLGEGAYYVSIEKYRKQFIEKLGFDPYLGTLNLKLIKEYDIKAFSELESYPSIEIDGFKDKNRSFGPVKCYPAIINNKIKGALISALRGHYDKSIIEVIAPVCLRKHLELKDGNKIKIEILTLP